jgi:sulfate adenylyltransferase subunit 1 (EFTu-like GTPase family)
MDVLVLIDKLDDLVHNAKAVPLTDQVLAEAREQAVREASQTEIVKIAERQAQEIVDDARRDAREARLEMEDWADSMLASLEVNLDRFLTAVRRGRERLHERSQESVVGAGLGADGSSAGEDLY